MRLSVKCKIMANNVCHQPFAPSLEKSWLGSLIGHCSLSNPTGVLRNHHFDVSSYSNEKFGFPEVSGPGLYVYSRGAAGPNARQSLRETKTYDSWISWCMFYQIDFMGCPSYEFLWGQNFNVNHWKNQNQNVQYPKQSKCQKGSNIVFKFHSGTNVPKTQSTWSPVSWIV